MKELILGGARSGKSRLAQQRAEACGLPVTYVATATSSDTEMAARIERHRQDRPAHWLLSETPVELAQRVRETPAEHCLLIDCLTLWLNNLLLLEDEARFQSERDALLVALQQTPARVILVSNETNMGIVPLGELSRRFCDEAGWLHQALAAQCERVTLCVAGLPMTLKGES